MEWLLGIIKFIDFNNTVSDTSGKSEHKLVPNTTASENYQTQIMGSFLKQVQTKCDFYNELLHCSQNNNLLTISYRTVD